jgi:hypothetical protein
MGIAWSGKRANDETLQNYSAQKRRPDPTLKTRPSSVSNKRTGPNKSSRLSAERARLAAKLVASRRGRRSRRSRGRSRSRRSRRRGRGGAVDRSRSRGDLAVGATSGGVATAVAAVAAIAAAHARLRAAGLLRAAVLLRAAHFRAAAAATAAVVVTATAVAGVARLLRAAGVGIATATAAVTGRGVLVGADQSQADDREEHRDPKQNRTVHSETPKKHRVPKGETSGCRSCEHSAGRRRRPAKEPCGSVRTLTPSPPASLVKLYGLRRL